LFYLFRFLFLFAASWPSCGFAAPGISPGDSLHTFTSSLYAITSIGQKTLFAVGESGTIVYTRDAGAHWLASGSMSGVASDLFAIAFADTLHGYAVGRDGAFTKSADGGKNGNRQSPLLSSRCLASFS
jgi:photosystem II stability/assembly factor-like uncharacterized protein